MKDFLRIIWGYFVRDAQIFMSYRLNFLMQIGSLLLTVFSLYFMAKLVGQQPSVAQYGGYFPFAVIGFSLTAFFTTGFSSFSASIRNEQMMGTLESVMMTPARIASIAVASSAWNFIWSLLTTAVMIVSACIMFDIRLKGSIPAALLIMLLTTLTFSCFGVLSASFIMIFKKGDPMGFIFGTLSYLLGGVAYPISLLPSWLQKISYLLPISHGLNGLRDVLLRGAPFSAILPQVLILAAFSAVGIPLSLWCFTRAINIARREGSLLHY